MMTQEQFLQHLHRALNHLYEPDRLRQNPLATLFGVANRLDTFSSLQRILIETIESLEPAANEPPQSSAWDIYEPLLYRYVHHLNQQHVAKQLGMSVRHLRRKEHAALEVLACLLWERFKLQDKPLRETIKEPTFERPIGDTSAVSNELDWLRNTPPERPIDLGQALPEVVQLAEPMAAQHRVCLQTAIDKGLPELTVHEIVLRQTLLNLISVAIHRTLDGYVTILARPLLTEVEIRVRGEGPDTGARAASNDDATNLDLARKLADFCGGKLTLSDHKGFFDALLTLPALAPWPALVIDDNVDTLHLLRRYVAGTRYRLVTTRNPEQAVQMAEQFYPKIIVLDVMMPRVDGWKVLASLRHHPITEHIPIVVCTILAQEELALSLGANSFIRKPVTRQDFLEILDQQIKLMETECR